MNWTIGTSADPESGVAGYYLQVGTTPGGNDKFDGDVGNVLTYAITGCSNGATYYARVRAKNGSGLYGSYSNNSTGIYIDTTVPTGAPTPPTCVYTSGTIITVSWTQGTSADSESGISGYYLQVGTTPGGNDKFDGDVGNVLIYAITGCSNGTTYYARVRAKNGAGLYGSYSGNSNMITIINGIPNSVASTKLVGNLINPSKGGQVNIQFTIIADATVKITIYNSNGELIRKICNQSRTAGSYSDLYWDGKDDVGKPVASGVYIVYVDAGAYKDKKRVIIAE